MLVTSISLPLLASLVILLGGRYLNRIGTSIILITSLTTSVLLASATLVDVLCFNTYTITALYNVLNLSSLVIKFSVSADPLSVVMVVMVSFISLLVHLYSVEYMWNDPHFNRFMAYLSLFTFFMLALLVSLDLFQFFIGWEGVGLCSFLLISFWFTRTQASTAALKAFIVNRIGDAAFLLGLLIIGITLGELNVVTFLRSYNFLGNFSFLLLAKEFVVPTLLASCILIGAMSKSAQIFLHTWLPDAMEGPTPVSALIHAATMVAAGIFLISRVSPYLIFCEEFLVVFVIIGTATALFAATTGLFQHDIKKIIAYSTCSQLGFMLTAAGLGVFSVSLYHLITHAFFKALLFLVSGSIIHSLYDVQDIRRYGSLLAVLPYSYVCALIGSLALTGIPFFSGFYSKDLIIETGMVADVNFGICSTVILLLASAFTMLYSVKLLYMTFFITTNTSLAVLIRVSENKSFIVLVLGILAVLTIFIGWYLKVVLITNSGFLTGNFLSVLMNSNLADVEFLHYYEKHITLLVILTACYFGILINTSELNFLNKYWPTMGDNTILFKATYFFSKKWYFDNIYNFFIVYNLFYFSYHVLLKNLELGMLEFLGPYLLYLTSKTSGFLVERFRDKNLFSYLSYFIFGLLLILSLKLCPIYFVSIAVLLSMLNALFDYFLVLSADKARMSILSIFHPRKLVLLRREILKAVIFTIFLFLPAFFVLYIYAYIFYFLNFYYKYGDYIFIPAFILKIFK